MLFFPHHPAVQDPPSPPRRSVNQTVTTPLPPISCTPALGDCCNGRQKVAFEAQRLEIAALHSAEQRAVTRTCRIRNQLGTSELELSALEREMSEIGVCVLPCSLVLYMPRARGVTITAAFLRHAPLHFFAFS